MLWPIGYLHNAVKELNSRLLRTKSIWLQDGRINHFTAVCSLTWPIMKGSEAGDDLVLILNCFCCVNQVVLIRTSCIYMTKAERSVSKQGHLQLRFHLWVRSLSSCDRLPPLITKVTCSKWPLEWCLWRRFRNLTWPLVHITTQVVCESFIIL